MHQAFQNSLGSTRNFDIHFVSKSRTEAVAHKMCSLAQNDAVRQIEYESKKPISI